MRNWFGKVRKQPGRNLDGRLLREKKMKRKNRVLHKRRKRVLVERKGARSVMGARVGHLTSGRDSGPTLPGPEEEETV